MDLIKPVQRKIAGGYGVTVEAELVQWAGVPLMVHGRWDSSGNHVQHADRWTCSHEPTGYAIAHGPSRETALAAAIVKLRRNWAELPATLAPLPVINPPAS